MDMLQTSLRTADGTRRFNVPHTTFLWSRHRLQEIGTTWNHPRSWLPPGTRSSKEWHIRLKHLLDQWRPSTTTVAETPGRHNPEFPHGPCIIISGDLHWVPHDRIEAPSWIDGVVLQGSTGLLYNAFPFSICLTQDFPRSNAVHTLS